MSSSNEGEELPISLNRGKKSILKQTNKNDKSQSSQSEANLSSKKDVKFLLIRENTNSSS